MSHRRTRRASRTAAAPLSRLPLQVERLERRSMLAADVGDPQGGVDIVEAALAVEIDPLVAVETVEACVLIARELVVDAGITTDPPDLWEPIAVDPGTCDVGVGDATGVGITDEVVIEPWFRVFRHDGSPIFCYCSGGLDGTVVADDGVASSGVTVASSADELGSMEVAVASAPENATFARATPTLSAGTSDTARLFAAYAAGLGQGGADAQAPTGFGGRRSGRRAH